VADVVLGGVAWWTHRLGLVDGNPNVKAWIDRLTARPAYKRATAD
jgi:glutathione S-transferase